MDPLACLIFLVVVIFSPPSGSFSRVTCGVSTSDIFNSGFLASGSTELAEVAELVLLVLLRDTALLVREDSVAVVDSAFTESGDPRSAAKWSVTSCFLWSAGLPPNRSLDESVTAELLSEVVDSLMEVVLELVVVELNAVDFANGSKSSKSPPGFELVVCKICDTNYLNVCAVFRNGTCL